MLITKIASVKFKPPVKRLVLLLMGQTECSVVTFFSVIIFMFGCNNYQKNSSHQQTSNSSIAAGKQLARTYCASCHQLPDPSMLDRKSWENGVLPQMGPRLGIFFYGY